MAIVSQKTDARNERAWAWFVRGPNKGIIKDGTGRQLAPIWSIPEAFTTDVNDVQGQFPVVYNTDRLPYGATHNTMYYYDSSVAGGNITTTPTAISLGKGVVSEEGGYILLDYSDPSTYNYNYDSGFLAVATNTPPSFNTSQHNHRANTYTPPSFIVPPAPAWYTYYIVWHLYTIIANQCYYNCGLSHYIDLFVNWIQQSRWHITQLPNEEIYYDGDVNCMIQDLVTGTNTLRIDIDSRKVIWRTPTSAWIYTDHSLLMRIKAKILLRKL